MKKKIIDEDLDTLQFEIHHNLVSSFFNAVQVTRQAMIDGKPDVQTIAGNAMEPYNGTRTLKLYFEKLGVDTMGDWSNLNQRFYNLTADDVFRYINGELKDLQ